MLLNVLHIVMAILLPLCAVSVASKSAENTALLIIDVQTCFTQGGSLAVTDADAIIPIINDIRTRFESQFDLVVQSQDWHCSDHVSFASQHDGYSPFNNIDLQYNDNGELCRTENISNPYTVICTGDTHPLTQTLWPDHCVINTTSAEFHQDLFVDDNDVIVHKGYHCQLDSYSAFYDNGHFGETDLRQIFLDNGISRVYIVGLATDYCVYYTAKDSFQLGFETFVVVDSTRGVTQESTVSALEDMENIGIHLINSTDVGNTFVTSEADRISLAGFIFNLQMSLIFKLL